jgi:hypothetical protein
LVVEKLQRRAPGVDHQSVEAAAFERAIGAAHEQA